MIFLKLERRYYAKMLLVFFFYIKISACTEKKNHIQVNFTFLVTFISKDEIVHVSKKNQYNFAIYL